METQDLMSCEKLINTLLLLFNCVFSISEKIWADAFR